MTDTPQLLLGHHLKALKLPTFLRVNAGARLHRFPEQRCINDADENALEHGLVWCASGWGRIVLGLVDVLAT